MLNNLGQLYFQSQRYNESVARYKKAIQREQRPVFYYNIARSLQSSGLNDEANDYFNRFVARAITDVNMHRLVIDAYYQLGVLHTGEQAIAYYRRAAELEDEKEPDSDTYTHYAAYAESLSNADL